MFLLHVHWWCSAVHQNYVGIDTDKNPYFLSIVSQDSGNKCIPLYRAMLFRKQVSWLYAWEIACSLFVFLLCSDDGKKANERTNEWKNSVSLSSERGVLSYKMNWNGNFSCFFENFRGVAFTVISVLCEAKMTDSQNKTKTVGSVRWKMEKVNWEIHGEFENVWKRDWTCFAVPKDVLLLGFWLAYDFVTLLPTTAAILCDWSDWWTFPLNLLNGNG